MEQLFNVHNSHREGGLSAFRILDPHLRKLDQQPLIHEPSLLKNLPIQTQGVFTIGGARQVGKSTFLKQWMHHLLKIGTPPEQITFLTGELIDDHHALVKLVQDQLQSASYSVAFASRKSSGQNNFRYIIVDEITYIRDWDKAVKFLADAGQLEHVALVLSGSDLVIIHEARMRFPGRRGIADQVDFHLYPLSFYEAVTLKNPKIRNPSIDLLYDEFQNYLTHGGFLTAINDMVRSQKILKSTFSIYADWIRGDILKRGKQEHYLRDVLGAVIKHAGSQVSWNTLSQNLSIDHPKTVADYMEILSSMDALFIQSALLEHKLVAAPKKLKKIMFRDPFIFHSLRSWLEESQDPFLMQVQPCVLNQRWQSYLAESIAITHFSRYYPTYYIKAEGEVDIAYIHQKKFWPIEVKWTAQLRAEELKQIRKYQNAKILSWNKTKTNFFGIPVEPLPLALYKLNQAAMKSETNGISFC